MDPTIEAIRFLVRESVAVAALFAMFIIYRWDRQQEAKEMKAEIGSFIEFGATRAAHDMQMGALLERLTRSIEKIEERLQADYVCPVSQVSTEILRDVTLGARRPATKQQLAAAIRDHIEDVVAEKMDGDGGD